MNKELDVLKNEFINLYGGKQEEIRVFHSPGRVNLIGEHTDYNGGYVFPAALLVGTYALIRPRNDNVISLASMNTSLKVQIDVNNIEYRKEDRWANYPKGVAFELIKAGYNVKGCDILFKGDVPNGSGLSSSASIEVATALALVTLFNGKDRVDLVELSKISQKAENDFVGVNCGIMDQFASALGKKNNAIFLNCDTLEFRYVPIYMDGHKIVITNTNKVRGLTDSKYNERRNECELGLEQLKRVIPGIKNLGEVSLEQFNEHKKAISESVIKNRVEHVIRENKRVLESIRALEMNDIKTFGELMIQSHESLRDLYEVTGIELDTLVEEALKCDGVIGSRMTGAGFGGCTVSIIEEGKIDMFKSNVGRAYTEKTGLKADFYISDIGDGARELR